MSDYYYDMPVNELAHDIDRRLARLEYAMVRLAFLIEQAEDPESISPAREIANILAGEDDDFVFGRDRGT